MSIRLLNKAILALMAVVFFSTVSFAATVKWARPSTVASPNWSVGSNWTGGIAPGAEDDVVFDDTSVLDSIIDANRVVNSITITSAYTGVITHRYRVSPNNVSLQVVSNYDQRGGKYVLENPLVATSYYPFTVGGSFYLGPGIIFSRYESSGGYLLVSDVYGLQAMTCSKEADYKLKNDIDASSTALWNYSSTYATYEGFAPIGSSTEAFTGTLDGNYKTVSGLNIEKNSSYDTGLFGYLGTGSSVSNLSVVSARITGRSSRYMGVIAGRAYSSNIENCYVNARLNGYGALFIETQWYYGMITGGNILGSISECYSSGLIYLNRNSQWIPYIHVGGISAYNSGTISDCYSVAETYAADTLQDHWIGGIAGYNASTVERCYATGAITVPGNKFGIGGLIGYNSSVGTAVNSYFSQSGFDNSIGQLKTPQQMSREATFNGWDFGTVWSIDERNSYPYFLWSVYNWIGESSGVWDSASDWNKNSGYPSSESQKAYINAGPYDIETLSDQALSIGGLKLGPDMQVKLTLLNDMTLSSAAGKSGSLMIYGGTFEGNGQTLRVYGDMSVSDPHRFFPRTQSLSGTGTLEIMGSSSLSFIEGNFTVNNLRCSVPYKRITLEAGSVHTVEGTLYLSGEADREIMLSSSVPGSVWYLSPESTVTANHLIVSDSYNLGTTINALNSYDGGNNTGWSFGGYTVTVSTNEGGSISPSGILGEILTENGIPTTLEITADTGYYIGYVKIDGTFEAGPYADPHMVYVPGDGHHSVEAYFVLDNVRIWDGGGADENWSTVGNWTGDELPDSGDSVVFNDISGDSDINSDFDILNLTIEAGYVGQITQASGHLTIEGDYIQLGGTVESVPTLVLDVKGSFSIPDIDGAFTRFTGSGTTTSDPYVIYDVYGLQAARCNLDSYFKLNNYIDASPTANWNWNGSTYEGFRPIGYMVAGTYGDVPDHPFTGAFNGGKNKITGLFINRADSLFIGLFGASISTHTKGIYDLGVSGSYVRGYQNVGGFVAYNASYIYDSFFRGEVYAEDYTCNVGGFVGNNSSRSIERCYTDAVVERFDQPYNSIYLGLFCGVNSASIRNSYCQGLARSSFFAGGFCGGNGSSAIINCYAAGTLDANAGGSFIGTGIPGSGCYYTQPKRPNFNDYGTYITQDELKDKDTFSGWDFDSVWSIDEGTSGPYLLWEYYNWTGHAGTTDWKTPGNWSKNFEVPSDYPRTFSDNVYLNEYSGILSTPSDAPLELGELVVGSSFTGTLMLGNGMTISSESMSKGSLVMCKGTIEAASAVISIEGNFKICNYSSPYFLFSSESSTVDMFGKRKESLIQMLFPVTKQNNFNKFRCITPGKTLNFYSGSSYYSRVRSELLISGEAGLGNLIVLKGTSAAPTSWYISSEGTTSVKNAIIYNSYNQSADIITAEASYDGGNNTRWGLFSGNPITATAGTGGSINPEGIIPAAYGETVEFTVSSDEGYYIGFVKIDGIATDESLSTPEVKFYLEADGNAHSIEAYFSETGTRTWTGGATDAFWSSPCNWTGNATPQANERVIFNQTSSKNSTINSFNPTNTIYALSIESASSVAVTQEASLTITTTYEQLAGTFRCDSPLSCSFTVGGDFIIPSTYRHATPPFKRMSGTGSAGDPFVIGDVYGLQGLLGTRGQTLYNYKLAWDIDASPTRRWNWNDSTHEGFVPIGDDTQDFAGNFDGNYYKITGLWINRQYTDKVGLFGRTSGDDSYGVISNLGLENSEVRGSDNTGGLIGWQSSRLINSYFDGYVSGETVVGGLVGQNFGSAGQIKSCFSRGIVKGYGQIGGLVGANGFYAQVYDSYSSASVEATAHSAGGLVGAGNYIYNCYAIGQVSCGNPYTIGGLIGAYYEGPVENNFFNNPLLDNGVGTLTSEANMRRRKNFSGVGWNFGRVWGIDEGRSYPYLQWEKWLWTGSAGDGDWTKAGNWNKNDSYPNTGSDKVYINTCEASTITMPGANVSLAGLQLGSDFNKVLSAGGTISLLGDGDNDGSLYIYGGTFDASSRTVNIEGNYYKSDSGSLSREGSTVTFADAAYVSLVEGNTRFNNLSITTAGKRLTFEARSRQTVEGTFTVTGSSGNQVYLLSSLRGVTWEIYPVNAGGASVSYAVVQDSKNVSVEEIEAGNSIDYGNNINWIFTDYALEVTVGSHGYVNTMEGTFYLSTFEGGTIEVMVSPESSSYYIADVKIDGVSTTEEIYHPGRAHMFRFDDVRRFYTLEAVFMAVGSKTWDGGGSTNNWSDKLNWTGNTTPGASDVVKFSSLSTKNGTVDASFGGVVSGVTIESGYTGTIRQVRSLTVNGSFEQGGGYFVCTTPTTAGFSVTGNFYLPSANGSFIRYSGTGTSAATAYIVHDVYGLQGVGCNLTSYFKVYYDIDASVTRNWNWNPSSGTYEGFVPIGDLNTTFTGFFSGESFVVRNLWIDRSNKGSPTGDYTGIFGTIGEGGFLHRFGVRNSHVRGGHITGGLVGGNSGTVSRCLISGGVVTGNTVLGGLVGGSAGTIEDSYSTTNVVLGDSIGGVFGGYNQDGYISRCYAAGTITLWNGEGFLGYSTDDNLISNCYYSTLESQKTGENHGALPLTPVEMKQQASFESWNFDSIWTIDEGKSYPSLLWEEWNWTALGDTYSWTDPLNWNKKSGYPSDSTAKVYINTGSGSINMPSDLSIGSLILGPNYSGALTLLGNLYLGNNGPREGSFIMLGGTLFSAYQVAMVVEGRFKRTAGTLTSNSTVIFTGSTPSRIEGSTTFYNLYCTKEGKSLIFESDSVQTVEGTLRLSSEAGIDSRITLRSSSEGSHWYIHPTGIKDSVYFVDVQDSVNLSPEVVNPYYSLNSGNNVNWFDTYYITSEGTKLPPYDSETNWGTIEPVGVIPIDHGTSRAFVATPRYSMGYKLSSLVVDGTTLEGVAEDVPYAYTFESVSSNHSIEAVFAIRPFLITAEVTGIGSGAITPSGTVEVGHNQRQVFTIEADAGSYIAFVRIDGTVTAEGLENPSYYPSPYWITFEGASDDHTVEAHFLPEKYYIWSGLGETNNWSEAANWTGNTTPDSVSNVIFNSLSSKNATIDADFQGTIQNISMESGYLGDVVIARIFTAEAGISIESGMVYSPTYEVYVRGDFYCSGEASGFLAMSGSMIFVKDGGLQNIYTGSKVFGGDIHTIFYDVIHSGSGKISVRNNTLIALNDVLNLPSSGTFELYGTGIYMGGDLINSSIFTQEIVSLELANVANFFIGEEDIQIIDMGGTGEGHVLPLIANAGIGMQLGSSLETLGILSGSDFDANGYDIYVTTILNNSGGSSNFIQNCGTVHIGTTPDILRELLVVDDWTIFQGPVSVKNIECSVPSKVVMFQNIFDDETGDILFPSVLTIEAAGYVTFEGGSASTSEYITMASSEGDYYPQWVIDPRCPESNRNFSNLYVVSSNNIDATSIEAVNSLDGGNNTGWVFGSYMITATQNNGGTIEPPGLNIVARESTVTYEVRSDDGYYIGYILKDGVAVSAEGIYPSPYAVTFEGVVSNHTIEAFFDILGGRTWTGAGTTENWSDRYNWSGYQVPSSLEVAIFNGGGLKDATVDEGFNGTIGGVSIESGYTGTITQARNLLITASFEQMGGIFVSAVQYAFTVEGSFAIPDTAGSFSRFSGSSPYIIYDVYGLQAMKCYKSSSFALNNDISAESTSRWNWNSVSGTYEGFSPVGLTGEASFTGTLNGRGFVINDLWIDRSVNTLRTYVGLFGALGSGSIIQDTGIRNSHIRGYDMVGALAGYVNGGTISGCFAKGGYTFGEYAVGGLIGRITSSSTIEDSYSSNMAEAYAAGGFIGNNNGGTVNRCYSAGYVLGATAGGFIGYGNDVSDSYYSTTDSGKTGENLGAQPLSAAEMMRKNSFSGWNFDRTWTIDSDKSYPQLMWEIYTWTGSADGTTWASPNNWNKRSGYPSGKENKAYINVGSSTISITPTSLGGLQLGPDFSGTVSPANDFVFDNTGTREGSLIVLGGTFNTNSRFITIEGNFKKGESGVFISSVTRFIRFSSEASSLVEGSTTFSDLVCNTPGKRLSFEAGSIQTVEGTLTVLGSAGDPITLESSSTGTRFKINPAAFSISNVSVKDSTNEGASVINPGGSSINLGNTSRWFTYYIYATYEEHAVITPEGWGQVVITSSDPITYTITTEVDSGYYVASVEVDGVSVGATTEYSFTEVMAYHTIEVIVTTEATPTDPPRGLRVTISGNNVVLSWETVSLASQYRIYKSGSKFAPITGGWDLADTTSFLTWVDTNATISTTESYYIVRALSAGGEGPNSSMGVYKKLVLTYNVGDTNDNVIGLPYTTSLQKASDIVTSIEGGTGPGTNQYISSVGIWNSSGQNYYTAYQYIDGIGWLGDGDAVLNPGTGILLLLSGNNSSASVEVSGADRDVELNFTYNVGDTNDNVIGLPYTTSLQKASDIVTSIEGGTGPGTNQYISSVGIWNSSGQNYYTAYQYIDGIGWLGDGDAVLNPGTGILLLLTGDKTWAPGLVIPARE